MSIPDDPTAESEVRRDLHLERVLSTLSFEATLALLSHYHAALKSPVHMGYEVRAHLAGLESQTAENEFLDIQLARQLVIECDALLQNLQDGASERTHRLVQMAISYFIDTNDAEDDTDSPIGFDDDAEVIRLVAREINGGNA